MPPQVHKYRCVVCGFIFGGSGGLKKHMRTHDPDRRGVKRPKKMKVLHAKEEEDEEDYEDDDEEDMM
jgi:hypothetical protein